MLLRHVVDVDPYAVAWRAPPKNSNYTLRWHGPQGLGWLVRSERNFQQLLFSGLNGCIRRRSSSNRPVEIQKYRKCICSSRSLSGWTSVVNSPGRSYRPPPQASSLSRVLQHLQYKHLFFNIDELQLQIQLLHLGCHWLQTLRRTRESYFSEILKNCSNNSGVLFATVNRLPNPPVSLPCR